MKQRRSIPLAKTASLLLFLLALSISAAKTSGPIHPLKGKTQEEAVEILVGKFWNEDKWLPRKLELKPNMEFIYTQTGDPKYQNGNHTGVQREKYPKLHKNYNWQLEGRWEYSLKNAFRIRLHIQISDLKDTEDKLPEGAMIEIKVIPHPEGFDVVLVPVDQPSQNITIHQSDYLGPIKPTKVSLVRENPTNIIHPK